MKITNVIAYNLNASWVFDFLNLCAGIYMVAKTEGQGYLTLSLPQG